MAELKFYAGEDFDIYDLTGEGSGIGFFGDGFGVSIPVGMYNSRTFITNSFGTIQGPEVDNCKYDSPTGVILGQTGVPVLLTQVPNYLATINPRFTHSSSVKVTNAEFRIFDRTNINNPAVGVTCFAAEVIHPDNTQTNNGSGDSSWVEVGGSGSVLSLVDSPGTSGLSPSGVNTYDTRHDWYIMISVSPDSIGSKTQFGAYISLEYL